MSAKLKVVKGEYTHALSLQGRLRESDHLELYTATGQDPDEIILRSWDISLFNWTLLLGKIPIAIFGVAPQALLGLTGSPWMVGTDEMKRYDAQIFIARNSIKYIKKMFDCFPYLLNYVDVRNKLSIKWLKWCGFNISDNSTPYGVFGSPFYRFDMERKNV